MATTVAHWNILVMPVHKRPTISYLHVYGSIYGNSVPDGIKQSRHVPNVSTDQWGLCIKYRSQCRDGLWSWEDWVERLGSHQKPGQHVICTLLLLFAELYDA